MQPNNRLSSLLAALAMFCLTHGAVAQEASTAPTSRPLVFGVLNQQSAIQTAERWNPILQYLTHKTGIPLKLRMGATVGQTDAMMGREEFDLAYTNHNFQAEFDGKYKVLARWAGKPIKGIIAVSDDSPIRTLDDLQGRPVSFPSMEAFVAYAVPTLALRQAGVTVVERFAGNQDGALAQLKAKQVEAAAVNSRFLEAYAEREKLKLRNIYASEPFHELPVLIHPRVPARQAVALKGALLEMRNDPDGRAVMEKARCPGFAAAEDRDYDNVRALYRATGH